MKLLSGFLLFLLIAQLGMAEQTWHPRASLEDSWRWNKLTFLDKYRIVTAAKGLGEDVWFAHENGLLRYDGREVEEHSFGGETIKRIQDLFVSSSGDVYLLNENSIVLWSEGSLTLLGDFYNHVFLRNVFAEDDTGNVFAATSDGMVTIRDKQLVKLETGLESPVSLLIDAKGYLWTVDIIEHKIAVFEIFSQSDTVKLNPVHVFDRVARNSRIPMLFLDSKDRVWVLDSDDSGTYYCYDNYQRKKIASGWRKTSFWDQYTAVAEIPDGEFWFAAQRNLDHFYGETFSSYNVIDFPVSPTLPYLITLPGNRLLLGGDKYTPRILNLSTERFQTLENLHFQCEAIDGTRWFITNDRKVVSSSGDNWQVHDNGEELISTPNRIIAGSDGDIWVSGGHNGSAAVSCYMNGHWERYLFPEIGKTFSHLAAIETQEGIFVFGGGTPRGDLDSAKGGGVVFRLTDTGYEGIVIPPPAFLPETVNIVERAGDGLWLSSEVLYKSSPNAMFAAQRSDINENYWIDRMTVDKSNDLWIACLGGGVFQYDGTDKIRHDYQTGLNDVNVMFIIEDKARGGVLALSESGFYRYDGFNWSPWGFKSGIAYKRQNHTVFQDLKGAIWVNFASRAWFLEGKPFIGKGYSFKTVRYTPENEPPQTYAAISRERFPEGSQIHVEVTGADLWEDTPRDELEYSWKLNDNQWSGYSAESHIVFTDLAVGTFELQVKARDRSGNVDPSPARVSFAVILPVWKQAWFIFLVLMTFALIVFLVLLLFRVRIKAALAIDEFKLDFFTNISHELRNPLAVIITPIELMLESVSDSEMRKKLLIVLRNARKMQGMVDQLLQFRKIDKGRWQVNPEGGELISFVRETLYNQESLWQEKDLEIEFSVNTESHLCNFDPTIVQRIVDNLASNAVKYSDAGTKITVKAEIVSTDDHDELKLMVEDAGVGIPIHEQAHVLKPFYRIKRDEDQAGSGIGLALVNDLVNLSGGSISIKSPVTRDGKGTRFTVMLPIMPFDESEEEDFAHEFDDPEEEDAQTMLIVEDNKDLRHVLSQTFSRSFIIKEAGDGIAGFTMAHKVNPAIIISDVMMPGMDGFALCEKLKSDPDTSHIPVILLTAKSTSEHRLKGLQTGADAYIAKPLDIQHLRARIRNLLETRLELKRKFSGQLRVEPSEIAATPTDQRILEKAIKIVEENMQNEEFDVVRFGELMGMSGTSLRRKIKGITGQSPLAFIQKMRIKRAAALLSEGNLTVSEVAFEVGIYDLSYFGKVFRKEFGITPSSYRERGIQAPQG